MTTGDSNSTAFSPNKTLFARLALLVFALVVLVTTALVVWMLGGVRDGQGLVAGALVLLLCLGVGGFIRWRCRLGLRTFLVMVTLLAIVLSMVAKVAVRIRQVGNTVAELKKEGVSVQYDLSKDPGWFRTKSGWLLPPWTRDLLGDAAFADVTVVRFNRVTVTAEQIDRIAATCPSLTRLDLYGTVIQPNALKQLPRLKNLSQLELSNSNADDEVIAALSDVRQLKWLGVRGSKVTPKGIEAMGSMPALDSIWWDGPLSSDAGVKALGLKLNLQSLSLINGSLTNTGVQLLSNNAPNAAVLTLRGNKNVDSEGAVALVKLNKLSFLDLSGTSVDDRVLAELANHESLKHLDVAGTAVTAEGVLALKRKRPKLKVRHTVTMWRVKF